jgi:tetratricopeptide (TPR) repeat protein
MIPDALNAEMQAAVACVTFLIGFASLRQHGARDRALQRSEAIYRDLIRSSTPVRDRDVEDTANTINEALALDPVLFWTLITSGLISICNILLTVNMAAGSGWSLALNPSHWVPGFDSILVMNFLIILVIGLGVIDYSWIRRDLSRRRDAALMSKVQHAIRLRRGGENQKALEEIEEVAEELPEWAWLHAFKGNCLAAIGEVSAAEDATLRATLLAPTNAYWHLQLAEIRWQQRAYEPALEAIDIALSIQPASPSAMALKGLVLEGTDRGREALPFLHAALRSTPDDSALLKARSRSLTGQEEHPNTKDLVQIIDEDDERRVIAVLNARARSSVEESDLEQALDDVNRVLARDPADVEARSLRALIRARLRRNDEAVADLQELAAAHVDSRRVNLRMAETYSELDEDEPAIELFSRVLSSDPDNSIALHGRLVCLATLGRHTQALDDVNKLIMSEPDSADYVSHRALIKADVGLKQESLRDFDLAVNLAARVTAFIHGNRGLLLYSMGQYDRAYKDFDAVVSEKPDHIRMRHHRAMTASHLGRKEAALADADIAVQADHSSRSYYVRGAVHHEHEDYEEAVADYRRALNLDPSDRYAMGNLASALTRTGGLIEAADLYAQTIALGRPTPSLLTQAGCLQNRLGNVWEAVDFYNQALVLDSTHLGALQHRARWFYANEKYEDAIRDAESSLKQGADGPAMSLLIIQSSIALGKSIPDNVSVSTIVNSAKHDAKLAFTFGTQLNDLGLFEESLTLLRASQALHDNTTVTACIGITLIQLDQIKSGKEVLIDLRAQNAEEARAFWTESINPSTLQRYDHVAEVWASIFDAEAPEGQ